MLKSALELGYWDIACFVNHPLKLDICLEIGFRMKYSGYMSLIAPICCSELHGGIIEPLSKYHLDIFLPSHPRIEEEHVCSCWIDSSPTTHMVSHLLAIASQSKTLIRLE